jgi:hypothetical protein
VALPAPFLFAGAIKSAYDLTLWAWFRRVPLAEVTTGDKQLGGPLFWALLEPWLHRR